MSRATKAKPNPAREYDEQAEAWASDIEAADAEAVYILMTTGVIDIAGTGRVGEAIARIAGREWLPDDPDAIEENIDAALVLGIAIGRRLGSHPLTGGVR